MDDDETNNLDDWAAWALRQFLARCFASCATTLQWDAEALRAVAARMAVDE